jgi:hypothetical protein
VLDIHKAFGLTFHIERCHPACPRGFLGTSNRQQRLSINGEALTDKAGDAAELATKRVPAIENRVAPDFTKALVTFPTKTQK